MKIKAILTAVLASAIVAGSMLTLAGCGGESSNKDSATLQGTWEATAHAETGSNASSIDDEHGKLYYVFEDGKFYVVRDKDGKMSTVNEGTYTESGDTVTVTLPDGTLTGSLKDGSLTFDHDDSNTSLTFSKSDTVFDVNKTTESASTPSSETASSTATNGNGIGKVINDESSAAVSEQPAESEAPAITTSGLEGEWEITKFTNNGYDIIPELKKMNGYALMVFKNGKATLEMYAEGESDKEDMGAYTINGNEITITLYNDSVTGKASGNKLVFEDVAEGAKFYLELVKK